MLLGILSLVFASASVCARISNVTIDDTLGDELTGLIPQYAPEGWVARSTSGAPCGTCTAQPDATYIFKGTWHDKSTYKQDQIPSTISISFNGTRIYVYFILFNNVGTIDHNTRLRFYLDGSSDPARHFLHLGNPEGEKYLYNQLVYDSQALEPANHTLIVSSYSNGTDGSLALFDRAIYTTGADGDSATQLTSAGTSAPSASTPVPTSRGGDGTRSHHPSRLGVVIGCAVPLALVSILATYSWVCVLRRRRGAHIQPLEAHLRPLEAPTAAREETKAKSAVFGLQPAPDDSARLRSELGQTREELERMRRIAEPPEYTLVSVSS